MKPFSPLVNLYMLVTVAVGVAFSLILAYVEKSVHHTGGEGRGHLDVIFETIGSVLNQGTLRYMRTFLLLLKRYEYLIFDPLLSHEIKIKIGKLII